MGAGITNGIIPGSGGGTAFKGALVKLTANEVFTTAVAKSVPWDAAVYDTDSFWSGGAATRLTIPAGVTKVRLSASVAWLTKPITDAIIEIHKGGANVEGSGASRIQDGEALGVCILSGVLEVVEGDYFELNITQSSGADKSVRQDIAGWTYFSIEAVA